MPSIALCTPNLKKVHAIDLVMFDADINLKYNALSEFSFSIPESMDGNKTILFSYELIKTKKYLHIENIGYFIIQEVSENDEGHVKIKEVKCESLEAELKNKKITGFERVSVPIVNSLINVKYEYTPLYEGGNPDSFTTYYEPVYYPNGNQVILSSEQGEGLIDTVIEEYIPNWSVDMSKPIPESLIKTGGINNDLLIATIVRGFKISDTNVYTFLTSDLEKAFGCAVIFNKEERSFYFEDMESVQKTNIFLSYDNLLKSSEIKEYSDEIATSLSCYGAKGMSINYANPLGNTKLYNFDYFKTEEWMSQNLIEKISEWKEAIGKELTGTVGGTHPGEAWGLWYDYSVTPSPSYIVRWLDLMYDSCIRYGEITLNLVDKRLKEMAGQMRLLETVPDGSNESKYYKTNINYTVAGYINPYPTVTETEYYGELEPCATINFTTQSQTITEGISQPSFYRKLLLFFEYTPSMSGTITIKGTNKNNTPITENVVFSNQYQKITTNEFKTVTEITVFGTQYGVEILTITGYTQYIGGSISIPPEYRLKNLYKWFSEGGLSYIRSKGITTTLESRINQAVLSLKVLESGERFSNFVEYLFETYEEIYHYDVGKTYLEHKIEEQEILKAAAIEAATLTGENVLNKEDHITNIKFLREFYAYKFDDGVGYAQIPSVDNTSRYVLNNDGNKLDAQSLIDNYIYFGTTSDGELVNYKNCLGGLHQIEARILALNFFADRLNEIMSYISSSLDIREFFGSMFEELSPFIIENTYQNEHSVNYSGEIKDKISTSIDLYNQSLEVIDRIASPRFEISLDSVNFINLFEYKRTRKEDNNKHKRISTRGYFVRAKIQLYGFGQI